MQFRLFFICMTLSLLLGCKTQSINPKPSINTNPATLPQTSPVLTLPEIEVRPLSPTQTVTKPFDGSLLKPTEWSDFSWQHDQLSEAWPAWLLGCQTLQYQSAWANVCAKAFIMKPADTQTIMQYFQANFNVYRTSNLDGTQTGLITGYYEPLLRGSRTKTAKYKIPIYKKPIDLVTLDDPTQPTNKRLRGRLDKGRMVNYYTRAEIEATPSPLAGQELVWLEDAVEAFFLQVQGSGFIILDNGEKLHIGYADQNGQTYNSIGRLLVQRGELTLEKASMQSIKEWVTKNPSKSRELLDANPSYIFFKELPAGLSGPLGALGVPLLGERTVAVDTKYIPLGSPLFLSTTEPNSNKPLNRLIMAQDTGGAIKGGVRADYYWGAGEIAGKNAGGMKQQGKIWLFLPKDFPFIR